MSDEVLVGTVVNGEATLCPKGSEEAQRQAVVPGGIGQIVHFFRKS